LSENQKEISRMLFGLRVWFSGSDKFHCT